MGLLKGMFAAKAGRSILSRLTGNRSTGRRRRGSGGMLSRLLSSFTGSGSGRRV